MGPNATGGALLGFGDGVHQPPTFRARPTGDPNLHFLGDLTLTPNDSIQRLNVTILPLSNYG